MRHWLRDVLINKLAKWPERKLTLWTLLPFKERTNSAKLNSLAHILELSMLKRMSRDISAPHVDQFFIVTNICQIRVSDKKIKWTVPVKILVIYFHWKVTSIKLKKRIWGENVLNCELGSKTYQPKLPSLHAPSVPCMYSLFSGPRGFLTLPPPSSLY